MFEFETPSLEALDTVDALAELTIPPEILAALDEHERAIQKEHERRAREEATALHSHPIIVDTD